MGKYVILSDIHANLSALESVCDDFTNRYDVEGIFVLGDIVNYGMRPNDVIRFLKSYNEKIIVNLFGNHEKAFFDGDISRFSTERGKRLLSYTKSILTEESASYISSEMIADGMCEINIDGKKILAVHGCITNIFWGKMNETEMRQDIYAKYDFVLSGHSHIPHLIEKYYYAESLKYRNRKRTIFINPGSVGQPRNHNPKAQYVVIDFLNEEIHFNSVGYDIALEQALYPDYLDKFYSERLNNGI